MLFGLNSFIIHAVDSSWFLIFEFVVIGLILCGEGITCFGTFGAIFSWPLELVFHDSNDCYLNALAVNDIYQVSL